ncbi:MAG: hypothetical protein V7L25_32280 [Nostoc sp.]
MIPNNPSCGLSSTNLLFQAIAHFKGERREKAAAQLKLCCEKLPKRPLSLWDAEYGCASFVKQTADRFSYQSSNIRIIR